MSDALLTFVIPTIGRPSLKAAVQSVFDQTIPAGLIVAHDGPSSTGESYPKFAMPDLDPVDPRTEKPIQRSVPTQTMTVGPYYHESLVRNEAIRSVETPWVAYLDDDDEVDPHYAFQVQQVVQNTDPDVIIFQQTFPSHDSEDHGVKVFPNPDQELISWGNVGISYAVKTEWAKRFPFKVTRHEDLLNLVALEAAGAKMSFLPFVAYYGRGARIG